MLCGAEQNQAHYKDISRRLDRIERQLDSLNKIWLRTRHVEPAVQALLRERYLDPAALPYPERLTAQRFRLGLAEPGGRHHARAAQGSRQRDAHVRRDRIGVERRQLGGAGP